MSGKRENATKSLQLILHNFRKHLLPASRYSKYLKIDYKLFTSIYLKTFGSLTFLRVWVREDELSSVLKRKRTTKSKPKIAEWPN